MCYLQSINKSKIHFKVMDMLIQEFIIHVPTKFKNDLNIEKTVNVFVL